MSSLVSVDAFVSINGVDMSASVMEVEWPIEAEMVDETTMGQTTRINKAGLKSWSTSIKWKQDYGASPAPDVLLFAIWNAGTPVTIIVRPVKSTVVGATNPNYTGSGVLESYNPISGSVGDLATADTTFQCAGPFTRAVV